MKNTIGNYVWHYVDNEDKIEGLEGNHRYIVCVEASNNPEWHMVMAYWYEEGDELTIYEANGTPHYFKINESGFYIVNETGKGSYKSIFRIRGVRYWTDIKLPEVKTEDVLTIE